jgi:hypothetical protein
MERTVTSRFEIKYLVTPAQAQALRRHFGAIMRPDRHALRAPGHAYPICSLYLDGPDLPLYRTTTEGRKNRFKLRLRTYEDAPEAPVFLEIKRRMNQVIMKTRARVTRETAQAVLTGGALPQSGAEFASLAAQLGSRPVMRVKYLREAYESPARAPLRITLDTQLEGNVTPEAELAHGGLGWFGVPAGGVILEIKFTERLPPWVMAMARDFGLQACSVPKYILSVDRAMDRGLLRPEIPPVTRAGAWLPGGA